MLYRGIQDRWVIAKSSESTPNILWKDLLQLQYFGHLMQRADSLEKTLMLGKTKVGWEEGAEDKMVR